jgi:arylsulfatase A
MRVRGNDRAGTAPLRRFWPLCFSAVSMACGGASPTATAPLPAPSATPGRPGPPNVILIVADDMGWGDLSSYGSPTIKTPEIDRLAVSGVRLTQFVVVAALCTPSRGAILTGLYPVQSRITANLGTADDRPGLNAALPSLGTILKGRGYATAAIGKWGLGDGPNTMPLQNGFDSYYGKIYGATDRLIEGNADAAVGVPAEYLEREYATRAAAFIQANAARPFFLYYATHIPHTPLQPAPEFKGRSAGGRYGDVVEELDDHVGHILQAVRNAGVERSTLVWFLSDNGPYMFGGADGGSPGPFGGPGKGTPYESGIRVPGIVSWPGTVPAGQVVGTPVSSIDIVPTLAAIAGASLPSRFVYFGADVQPVLTGKATTIPGSGVDGGREIMAFYGSGFAAFRSGRYKIVFPGWWVSRAQLFDLETDPFEDHDLRASRRDLFEKLSERTSEVWAQAASNAVSQ